MVHPNDPMTTHPRYRVENDEHCIDVRLATLDQLFDNRDPAPFRERDLDPALVEYLVAAAEDLSPHGPFRVSFWFTTPVTIERVEGAYRAHFEYELQRADRCRTRERRTGQLSFLIGVILLAVLVSLAQLATPVPRIGPALKEGLTISSWVVMWRPIQTLIYDWIPSRRHRKLMTRLLVAPVGVREGCPPGTVTKLEAA